MAQTKKSTRHISITTALKMWQRGAHRSELRKKVDPTVRRFINRELVKAAGGERKFKALMRARNEARRKARVGRTAKKA